MAEFIPTDYGASESSLKIKAVGAYWMSSSPKEGHYSCDPWVSGANFGDGHEINNNWYMGIGFVWPSNISLSSIVVKGISFYAGDCWFDQLYREYRYGGSQSGFYYGATADSTKYGPKDSDNFKSLIVTSMSPFIAYAGDRFSKINYSNRSSYKALETLTTSNIKSGASLTSAQINFFVRSWANGRSVGTPDYKGKYITYEDYSSGGITYSNRAYISRNRISRSEPPYLIVTYEPLVARVTPSYPVDVCIKSSNSNVFSWVAESNRTTASGEAAKQVSYVIKVTKTDGTEKTFTGTTENQYATIPSNSLSTGIYSYTITSTMNTGEVITSIPVNFTVIGTTEAPDITNVSNNAMPTVTWSSTNQDAVEIKISQSGELLWKSDLILGSDRTSYKIPHMFEDGNYTVELRLLNTYGYYTEYDSAEVTINPTKPSAPSNISVSANVFYGIDILGTPASNCECYVVRRELGSTEVDILGKYENGFTDYTQKGNTYYEYTLRSYNAGYKDGEWCTALVNVDQLVIHDGRDYLNSVEIGTTDSKQFTVISNVSSNNALIQCLGRIYPIKERSPWLTETKLLNAFVTMDDYLKLLDMSCNANKVYYKATNEFIVCDMELTDRGEYVNGGRLISIALTRIEDDAEVVL